MIKPRGLLSVLALTSIAWVAQGCNGDTSAEKSDPADAYYRYGPLLSSAQPQHRVSIDAIKTAVQAGEAMYLVQREVSVHEVFLVCWPNRDWPSADLPQLSIHPAGDSGPDLMALTPRGIRRDRVYYDVPNGAPVTADYAVVDLAGADLAECPELVFGARGTITPAPRTSPPPKPQDDTG
jgi:hypothetical protein